jgi:hypothetical protein
MRAKEIILIAAGIATGVLAACEALSELKETPDEQ